MKTSGNAKETGTRKITVLAVALLCASLLVAWLLLEGLDSPELEIDLTERTPASTGNGRPGSSLKIAVASMTSPQSTYTDYRWIIGQMVEQAKVDGGMTISPSYKMVREGLETGEVDVAFVCTGTYARMHDLKKIELLAQPKLTKGSDYRCVIISRPELEAQTVSDLKGRIFAFSDPESNTGCFIPSLEISKLGWRPENYFAKILYTGSHDRSVQAVVSKHVDAAAVDKLILDKLVEEDDSLKEQYKTIWESKEFGPPPVVVRADLPEETKEALRRSLLELHQMPNAMEHMARIGVERFLPPDLSAYEGILALYRKEEGK